MLGRADRNLAADRPDPAFELSDTGLSGIAVDQFMEGLRGKAQPDVGQPVLANLAWHQVALGDLDLLILGIAGQADDFHSIEKSGLNGVGDVGGGDEENPREIDIDPEVVVAKGVVLLRIEDLEQRRRRVATKVGTDLVDFVEHEDRIDGARLLQTLNHPARQGADIGPPVAANLGLVADPTERGSDEAAAQRPGDGPAEGGLSNPRRA